MRSSVLGVLVTLWAAFAVLVHHDSSAVTGFPGSSSAPVAAMAAQVPGLHSSSAHKPQTGYRDPTAHAEAPAGQADDAMECSHGDAQHCAAASIETVKLSPPKAAFHATTSRVLAASSCPASTRSVERAPPELSFLSRLRI
ncbi:DUF6153 family protein [Streptomyces sp. NPDC052682]|uniref:DUF6153 family protein n=1 Tax=Streptomyces sp. NPDC052682 TaxID=3154954 RepID=UPI0034229F4A